MDYRDITPDERIRFEDTVLSNIETAFDEIEASTVEWLNSPEAKKYFVKRQGRITQFFQTSGLNTRWQQIIHQRATRGADIAELIYDYARNMDLSSPVKYNPTERSILNRIADSHYERIKGVTTQQIQSIREHLLMDYANGENPLRTNLKDVLLEPINGLSPQQRAEMIARTESAIALNSGRLGQYAADGIEYVEIVCDNGCDECASYIGEKIPIQEAMETPAIHPNCRCTWVAATGELVKDPDPNIADTTSQAEEDSTTEEDQ